MVNYLKALTVPIVFTIFFATDLFAQDIERYKADITQAISLLKSGQFDAAKPIVDKILAASETEACKDPNFGKILDNLILIYFKAGRYDLSQMIMERSVAIKEETLGKDHEETIIARQNLADLKDLQNPKFQQWQKEAEKAIALIMEGKIDEASTITDELIRRAKADFMDNGKVARNLYDLGCVYRNKTVYGKAIECLELCLKIDE